MSEEIQIKTISQFGGTHDGDPELVLPDDAARLALNTRFVPEGIRPQYGYQRLVDETLKESGGGDQIATALYDYQDGEDQHLLVVAGDSLLELSDWDDDFVDRVWVSKYTSLPKDPASGFGYRTSFITAFGRCYIQNGYMDPIVYDAPADEIYGWGIDGPPSAPVVTDQDQVGGIGGESFGEFDDFKTQWGWWGPSVAGDNEEGPIGKHPVGWENIYKTKTLEVTNDTPSTVGSAVELWSGHEKGNYIATGGYKLTHSDSKLYDPYGDLWYSTPAGDKWIVQYYKTNGGGEYDRWKTIRSHLGVRSNPDGSERNRQVRIKTSFGREIFTILQQNTIVSGRHSRLKVSPIPTGTFSTKGFEYFSGPYNGILRREITGIDLQSGVYSVGGQIKSDHAFARFSIRGFGPDGVQNSYSDAVSTGSGDWEYLTINSHAFHADDVTAYIYLEVDEPGTGNFDEDLTGRKALFDEIRIVEGALAPQEGGALDGVFRYSYGFFDEKDQTRSSPSPISNEVEVTQGVVDVTLPEGPNSRLVAPWYDAAIGEHSVTHVRICRAQSLDGGLTFGPMYAIDEILLSDIETAGGFPYSYTDNTPPVVAVENEICGGELIDPPRGKYMAMYEGMMVVAGFYNPSHSGSEVVDGRTLFYSEPGRPGVFPIDNYFEIDTNDNDQITGLAVNHGRLWVFTQNEIWEVTKLGDSFAERAMKRHDGVGCATGFGVSSFGGITYFPDRNGMYALHADGSLTRPTDIVELTWQRAIDFNQFQMAVLTNKKLWINSLDFLWCYDMEQPDSRGNGKWSTMYSYNRFWTVGGYDNGADRELIMADDHGYVYVMGADYTRQGINEGTVSGVVDSGTVNTLTDTSASFYDDGDGLEALWIWVWRRNDKGITTHGERHRIQSNTSDTITLEADDFWIDISGLNEGTVAVTNGSAVVTGTGTAWDSSLVGEEFVRDGDSTSYTIQSVDSATQITLDTNYGGTTGSGLDYSFPTPPDSNDTYEIGKIEWVYATKWHHFGQPGLKKLLKRIRVAVDSNLSPSTRIYVSWAADHKGNTLYSAQKTSFPITGEAASKWINARLRGYLISVVINAFQTDTEPIIKHIEMELEMRSNRV